MGESRIENEGKRETSTVTLPSRGRASYHHATVFPVSNRHLSPPVREPRWYHERWAMLMLLLLVPPVGLLAGVSAPQLRLLRKLVAATALVGVAGFLAALEEDGGYFSRFTLDLASAVAYQQGALRYAKQPAARTEALVRAYRLEPSRSEGNTLGERPGPGDSAFRLGRNYLKDGDLHRARLWFHAASLPKNTRTFGDAQLGLAQVELAMGLVERAAARMNAALDEHAVSTDDPEFVLLRGRLLTHSSATDARATLMSLVWRRAIPFLEETYPELAALDRAEGKPRDALRHYLQGLRVAPANAQMLERALAMAATTGASPVAVRAFARACHLQGSLRAGATARAIFSRLLERHPGFPGAELACLHIGAHLERQERDPQEAIRWYRRASELAADRHVKVEALAKLGRVYVSSGMPKGARKCFQRVLEEAEPESYYRRVARNGLERLSRSSEVREKLERIDHLVERFVSEDDEDE